MAWRSPRPRRPTRSSRRRRTTRSASCGPCRQPSCHARQAGARRAQVLGLANLSDYYLKRGQYDVALKHAQEALPLARAINNGSVESLALTNSGLALVSMRRKDEGLASVRAGLAIDERTGAVSTMSLTYKELGLYLEKAGYLPDAMEAYRAHRKLADEVFQHDQQQAILELQESYDHERRQRDLALLNQENRLKEEQLLGLELQQRLWAAGAAAGVLLLFVVALLHRRVRESNAALVTSNELLKRQSERDPLTGLANRRHFQDAMRRLAADGRLEGTLFLLDIDHFKQINDVHGHAAGDAVLVEVAQRLRSHAARAGPHRALGRRGVPDPGARPRAGAGGAARAAPARRDRRRAGRDGGPRRWT